EGGRIYVQIDRPLPEVEQARIVASLRAALIQADADWLGRECVRLLEAQADPTDVVRAAVRYGGGCGAGASNCSVAACADFARIAPLYEGLEQAIPLSRARIAVATANRGRPQLAIPERARGVLMGSARSRRETFVRLVEER